MYCNDTEVAQLPIKLDGRIYSCSNQRVMFSCAYEGCPQRIMTCDTKSKKKNVYCTKSSLYSRAASLCDTTSRTKGILSEDSSKVLNCHTGSLSKFSASFIPSIEGEFQFDSDLHLTFVQLDEKGDQPKNSDPTTLEASTTDIDLVYSTEMHVFLLKLIRTGYNFNKFNVWAPEASTIPPATMEMISKDEENDWHEWDFIKKQNTWIRSSFNFFARTASIIRTIWKQNSLNLWDYLFFVWTQSRSVAIKFYKKIYRLLFCYLVSVELNWSKPASWIIRESISGKHEL